MTEDLKLKVVEAVQDDVNKGIVRIDSSFMQKLGIRPGDIVELEGERKTVAIADRAYPGDIGLAIIRMDGLIRKNARTSIGELIKVRKSDIKEAKRIVVAPAKKGVIVRASPATFKHGLLGRAVVKGDIVSLGGTRRRRHTMTESPFFEDIFSMLDEEFAGLGFGDIKFVIADTNPKQSVIITDATEVVLNPEAVEIKEEAIPEVTYEDIGGLDEELKKIREMVELPLKHPEVFERLGIEPPKGVLLHGPPGTGKTLLAKAVANETNANFLFINGPEIMSKFYGESEQNIRKKFEEAEKNAPSIIFIDEIDAIASKREETIGEVERRVVAQLLSLMDGLKSRGKVVVIAASNRPNALDPALRRPGRFDREVEIGVPKKEGRLNILKIHTRNMPLDKTVNLKKIADITHGFVGADLSALCKEAAIIVLRRILPELKLKEDEAIPKDLLEELKITHRDFMSALKVVRPSAMREVLVEIPSVKWEEVGGLDSVKQELKEAVEWPLKFPDAFKRLGVNPPKGILLYGAPGVGKTLLAKAVATESEANFISVKGPELLCISGDTKIITSSCGATAIETFYQRIIPNSKLIENTGTYEVRDLTNPVYTFALGERGEIKKTRIKTVHKIWVNDAYKITLTNNTELTGSANQPLLTYRNGALEWTPLKNIKINDYVAYPRRLEPLDVTVPIPPPRYKHLTRVKEDKNSYVVRIFSTKEITRLPKKLTPALAAFLGWFVAEGNISKECISICNYNKEYQKEIKELFTQFIDNSRIRVYKDKVVAYSTPLIKYLEQILEQPLGMKKSYSIKCPSLIAKASKDIIVAFLQAAYKGDGALTKTKIEYASKSQALTEGFSYLLTILGIKARYWKRKDDMFMLTISGKKEIKAFNRMVYKKEHDGESFQIRKEYNAQYSIPPVGSLLKKIKEKAGLRYDKEIPDGSFEHVLSGRRTIGLLRLQKIMNLFERTVPKELQRNNEFVTLQKIAKGDCLWTKVKSKKEANAQEMFDVETEDHSFVGGNIPLLLHNSKWVGESEKAVRKVFEKARQTSPTIIFFDEIDSLAPRRGASSDSHVTERVVNQILTEIDGLEELQDVVVIGATNRPDIVDPALLRPGRFDRIILVDVPDKETRKRILDVHTAQMPLDHVDLDKVAEMTEGYVGADIEAVCREAAIHALRNNIKAKEITMENFKTALEKVGPSVTQEISDLYRELLTHFSSARAKQMKDEKPSYFG